ncbi:MAG: hypothetical protein AAGA09_02440 [Pseudomonadota bacterium]
MEIIPKTPARIAVAAFFAGIPAAIAGAIVLQAGGVRKAEMTLFPFVIFSIFPGLILHAAHIIVFRAWEKTLPYASDPITVPHTLKFIQSAMLGYCVWYCMALVYALYLLST